MIFQSGYQGFFFNILLCFVFLPYCSVYTFNAVLNESGKNKHFFFFPVFS